MANDENDGWEYLLDIDDSDFTQSVSVSKPTQTILQPISPQRPVLGGSGSNKKNKLSYQIPGPAGVFQDAYELRNNENNVVDDMSTQDFVREIINRPEADDSFTLDSWLRAMEFAYPTEDTTGTIRGTLSSKIIDDVHGKYEGVKGICEGAVLVLQNCSIFCPSVKVKILNITRKALIKVFFKDGGST
ncbi:uncharacterized protein [Rutidosis leptorrhynchoides]|uniref:uncharacterized protein n=1 Tax=Rutidosis leptorrhynchoides TaxID=125765 RepID=UPI003A98D2C8